MDGINLWGDVPEDHPFRTLVYFIRCGWLVKIGHSRQLKFRWHTIEWPSPAERQFLGGFMSFDGDERVLHKAFAHLRVFKEWFAWAPEIAEFVGAHCENRPEWGLSTLGTRRKRASGARTMPPSWRAEPC